MGTARLRVRERGRVSESPEEIPSLYRQVRYRIVLVNGHSVEVPVKNFQKSQEGITVDFPEPGIRQQFFPWHRVAVVLKVYIDTREEK